MRRLVLMIASALLLVPVMAEEVSAQRRVVSPGIHGGYGPAAVRRGQMYRAVAFRPGRQFRPVRARPGRWERDRHWTGPAWRGQRVYSRRWDGRRWRTARVYSQRWGRPTYWGRPVYYRRSGPWGWGLAGLATGVAIGAAAAQPAPVLATPIRSSIGGYCATPVRTCALINPAPIGTGCSCRTPGGRARGSVVGP